MLPITYVQTGFLRSGLLYQNFNLIKLLHSLTACNINTGINTFTFPCKVIAPDLVKYCVMSIVITFLTIFSSYIYNHLKLR